MSVPLFPVPERDARGRFDLGEARRLQEDLRERLVLEDRLGPVNRIAGADVSYSRGDPTLYVAVVVLDAASLDVVETATAVGQAAFPYVPGYLSLREAPAVVEAYRRLRRAPDLLMVDGHGRAHPRRFGIASHLGVALDVPTVGVAKSVLVGEAEDVGAEQGSTARLMHRGEEVGAVVRTRTRVAPVYVSVGHRVGLETAVAHVLACFAGRRLPEPTRRAHLTVNSLRSGRFP